MITKTFYKKQNVIEIFQKIYRMKKNTFLQILIEIYYVSN